MELLTPREQRWKRDADKAAEEALEKAVEQAVEKAVKPAVEKAARESAEQAAGQAAEKANEAAKASLEAGIEATLKMKFDAVTADSLMTDVRSVSLSQMSGLLPSILTAASPEELRAAINEIARTS